MSNSPGNTLSDDLWSRRLIAHQDGSMIHLQIPCWPPSVNTCYITTKFGARVQTKKAKKWMEVAVTAIKMQHQGLLTLTMPVEVSIDLYPRTLARFDVDNYGKAVLDALKHGAVIEDDHLVHKLTLQKHLRNSDEKRTEGWVDVRVHPLK